MSKDIDNTNLNEQPVKTKKELYDEAQEKKRAERAKREAKETKRAAKEALKKKYQNPAYSTGGKILVWILVVAMIAAVVISLVYLILSNVGVIK